MPQIALACYSVRVRRRYTKIPMSLNDPELKELPKFFEDTLNKLHTRSVDLQETKKVLNIRTIESSPQCTWGIVSTGEYGYESDLIDIKGKKATYRRSTDQAELLPFFFYLYLPTEGDSGILVLQRFGVFGVRSILSNALEDFFSKKFPEHMLDIWPMVPDGVIDKILNSGTLRKITFRKLSIPKDISEAFGSAKSSEGGKVDVVISAKEGSYFSKVIGKIRNCFGSKNRSGMNEVVGLSGFSHDKILLEMHYGEETRTVDLSNLNKLRAHIDITTEVKIGTDGHPTYDSIKTITEALVSDLRTSLDI
ncbi:MAG: hypothetical protein QM691_08485 [Opitutaceae bacterium]